MNSENNNQFEQQTEQNSALQNCQSQLTQTKNQLLYLSAEFDNFRKRTEKEKIQWISNAQAGVILDILEIADNFDRAFANQKSQDLADLSNKSLVDGLELIRKSIDQILKKYDVQEITENTVFDPNLHEAVMQTQSPGHKAGDIVAVLQNGYKFKGQVLRVAKVSIAQ